VSNVCTCQTPDSFETYTAFRGAAGDHSGRNETGARKRCSQAGVLILDEATSA